jgi:serine protease inhibitor
VEIDEQGVTGAAFTMMANANGGIFNNQVIEFHVDRPFFFAVTSVDHSILFSGIIRNLP